MPDYPDVTYQRWQSLYASGIANRGLQSFNAWLSGSPNYQTWRQNQLDQYNADVSAYNAWASSPEGMRTQNEAANYNANYPSGTTSSGSPLNYQDVNPGNGFQEMAQGVSGLLGFVQGLQGMQMMAAQIAGQRLKNENQAIVNKWTDSLSQQKYLGLGYSNDWNALRSGTQLYSIYREHPELWKSGATVSPFSGMSYDLRDFDKGLSYRKQFQDLELGKAAIALRNQQTQVAKFTAKERQFYVESIQDIQRQMFEHQAGLLKGQLDFQKIEQDLRKKSIQWGIGLNAANTTINAVKTVASFFVPGAASAAGTYFPGQWNTQPSPFNSNPWEESPGYFGY